MSGGRQREHITGADQLLFSICVFIYPAASNDEIALLLELYPWWTPAADYKSKGTMKVSPGFYNWTKQQSISVIQLD